MDWIDIIASVFGVLIVLFVVYWRRLKSVIKELAEALVVLSSAVEDDKLTRDELKQIVEEFGDVIAEFIKLIGKK